MRILYCSDFPTLNTGYANVSRELVRRFQADGHEVIYLPIAGYVGGAMTKDVLGVEMLPALMKPDDILHWFTFRMCDLCVILKDPFPLKGIETLPVFSVFYAPITEDPVSDIYVKHTTTSLYIWLPSRYWIEKAKEKIWPERLRYLPHGVQKEFHPLDWPRERLYASLGFHGIDVLVGIVSVNRHRKLLPNQLEGIKIFMDNNPDLNVGVYLHASITPDEPAAIHGGWDLKKVTETLGIDKNIRFPEPHIYRIGLSLREMNVMYNAIDCLVNATTEGFGLPILESQASGTPVVTVNHGNGPEINFLGLNAKVAAWDWAIHGTRIAIPDPYSIAENIEKGISMKEKYRYKLSEEVRDKYDWDVVYSKYFRPELEKLESELDPKKIVEVA